MLHLLPRRRFAPAVVVGCLVSLPALAQTQALGKFGEWAAFVEGSDARKVCYMGAAPQKAEGKYTERGKIYFLVSHRPAEKVTGEISVEAGYAYKDGSEVTAVVDGNRSFKLFSRGENAWNYDAKTDRAMVEAMKTGKQVVIKGRSARGTATTDTYGLSGFTAAYEAISRACGVK
jgi:invasion protein IalB